MFLFSRRALLALAAVTALGMPVLPVRAQPASNPAAFVNDVVQQALTLLRNKQLGDSDRKAQLATLLRANFDTPRIARFVLGRYWNGASEPDRTRFTDLFGQWVVRTYSERFKEYSGESVKVTGSRAESDTSAVVASQLIHVNGTPPAQVNWHVRKEDSGYKIVDVEVEGISLALTERDEFSAVIQRGNGSVATLNDQLQQKLASGETPANGSLAPGPK